MAIHFVLSPIFCNFGCYYGTMTMKYLQLSENKSRILPFYLAMEEYAARIITDDDLFFMWQVNPTVIFGRNQLIENEVNLDYCRRHGIATYRRKSGGGCVYADRNNIMFSYITQSDNVERTYSRYTSAVVSMLRSLGLNAEDNGRNDILINGQKVSGNAFYHLPGHSIVHGTMLYDTDMGHMAHAITPSEQKLESKGVKSVPSRITTLSRHTSMSLEEFKDYARNHLCNGTITLGEADINEIEKICRSYLTPEFIMGNNPRCNKTVSRRIEGVGELVVSMELNRNVIRDINIAGDFFLLGDLDGGLLAKLRGVEYTPEAVTEALRTVPCEEIIMNLKNENLIKLITE